MSDVFVVHPSVFHDALRTDYTTQYRDSSREFLNLLRNHFVHKGKKIAFTSGEVFKRILDSPAGKTKSIWMIPEHLVEIDFGTYVNPTIDLKIDQSIVKLASKLCIKDNPFIVSTKTAINQEGASFTILTPKQAIDMYRDPQSRF